MDKKAKLILKSYHQLFKGRSFLERDVLGFLIFIREQVSDTVLTELCNFVAHRNRDRGITYTLAESINNALQSDNSSEIEGQNLFYSSEHIGQVINDFFAHQSLPALSSTTITEIIMSIISLLQAIPIMKKDGAKLCELEVNLFGGTALLCAQFCMPTDTTVANSFTIPLLL